MTKSSTRLRRCLSITCCLALTVLTSVRAETVTDRTKASCVLVKTEAVRLPDLNMSRGGHMSLRIGNEMLVVGGHTEGFVPTPTAEYYSEGQWHLFNTTYSHDNGFYLSSQSGNVIFCGGHLQPLGIGHTFTMERYDPTTHSFGSFGCLDRKRVMSDGAEIDSGRFVISGNWYANDGIGIYDGKENADSVKGVSVARSFPYVFRAADNDVIIFGGKDLHGELISTIVVDRLKGDSFLPALFEHWRPFAPYIAHHSEDAFIGDEAKGQFAYLLAVEDPTHQLAFARVEGTDFRLLPTSSAVPMVSPVDGVHIDYFSTAIADRQSKRGYLVGTDTLNRIYINCIDYEQTPCPLTLYYTDPLPELGLSMPVLTPEGNIMIAGGVSKNNFNPHTTVWLFPVNGQPVVAATSTCRWPWAVAAFCLLCAVAGVLYWLWRRHRQHPHEESSQYYSSPSEETGDEKPDRGESTLMVRLCQLMEEQQLYVNSDLKLQEVADLLGTNRTYLSNSIKTTRGQSFTQFVNAFRVDYAMKQLRQHPDKKNSAVWAEAGFSTESSFFRAFKAVTGVTPGEWKAQQGG